MVPNSLEEGHDAGAAGADFLQGRGRPADRVLLWSAALRANLPGASRWHGDEAADDIDVGAAEGHQLSDAVLEGLAEPLAVLLLDEGFEGRPGRDVLDQLLVCGQHVVPHPNEEST